LPSRRPVPPLPGRPRPRRADVRNVKRPSAIGFHRGRVPPAAAREVRLRPRFVRDVARRRRFRDAGARGRRRRRGAGSVRLDVSGCGRCGIREVRG
jgi:hypothetical protein